MEDNSQINDLYLSGKPLFVKWTMKYSGGYVKNEKQASYILLVVSIIFFLGSIFFFVISQPRSQKEDFIKNGYPKVPGAEAYEQINQ